MAEDKEQQPELSNIISGALNIFGLKIDLAELLGSPEKLRGQLEELREKLKAAGGKESSAGAAGRRGGASVSGHLRVRSLGGAEEYHIGAAGGRRQPREPAAAPPEVVEPATDLFDEGDQVTIVAEVPGVSLDDLNLKVEGRLFSLSTAATARRRFRKELRLEADLEPDSLQATCRNGVLEVRLRKRRSGSS